MDGKVGAHKARSASAIRRVRVAEAAPRAAVRAPSSHCRSEQTSGPEPAGQAIRPGDERRDRSQPGRRRARPARRCAAPRARRPSAAPDRTSRCSRPARRCRRRCGRGRSGACRCVTCLSFESGASVSGCCWSPSSRSARSLVDPGFDEGDHGIGEDEEVGPGALRVERIGGGGVAASKCVAAVDARWPPAEKPMMPRRSRAAVSSACART